MSALINTYNMLEVAEVLNFFPTPISGELGTACCAVTMRTGHMKSATTIGVAGRQGSHAAMGTFLPTKAINDISGQLSARLLDIRDGHPEPYVVSYFYRINQVEKKEQALKEREGRQSHPHGSGRRTAVPTVVMSELLMSPAYREDVSLYERNLLGIPVHQTSFVCLPEAWVLPERSLVQPGAGQRSSLYRTSTVRI